MRELSYRRNKQLRPHMKKIFLTITMPSLASIFAGKDKQAYPLHCALQDAGHIIEGK